MYEYINNFSASLSLYTVTLNAGSSFENPTFLASIVARVRYTELTTEEVFVVVHYYMKLSVSSNLIGLLASLLFSNLSTRLFVYKQE